MTVGNLFCQVDEEFCSDQGTEQKLRLWVKLSSLAAGNLSKVACQSTVHPLPAGRTHHYPATSKLDRIGAVLHRKAK